MKKIAISKMNQLKARGGEVIRTAQIVRMPDHSEVAIDDFGRCVWVTSAEPNKIGKEAVIQEKEWKLTTKKHPKTGVIEIYINQNKSGCFDDMDDTYCYFPANTHELNGDMIIAIGEKLNELNEEHKQGEN